MFRDIKQMFILLEFMGKELKAHPPAMSFQQAVNRFVNRTKLLRGASENTTVSLFVWFRKTLLFRLFGIFYTKLRNKNYIESIPHFTKNLYGKSISKSLIMWVHKTCPGLKKNDLLLLLCFLSHLFTRGLGTAPKVCLYAYISFCSIIP